jgi:hypothetical protein
MLLPYSFGVSVSQRSLQAECKAESLLSGFGEAPPIFEPQAQRSLATV